MNTLAKRLQAAIAREQTNMVRLAEAAGTSSASVSKWLDGKTENLRGNYLIKAAIFLRVNTDWLGLGIGKMERGDLEKQELSTPELLAQLAQTIATAPVGNRPVIGALLTQIANQPQQVGAMTSSLLALLTPEVMDISKGLVETADFAGKPPPLLLELPNIKTTIE
jgi:transcriptional regulator with XRE-family HTH domain